MPQELEIVKCSPTKIIDNAIANAKEALFSSYKKL